MINECLTIFFFLGEITLKKKRTMQCQHLKIYRLKKEEGRFGTVKILT